MISASISLRASSTGRGRPAERAFVLLGVAVALLVFSLLPPFLKGDTGIVHGFTGQELVDLFTPLVTMPLLVLAFELTGRMGLRTRLALAVLISIWVAGQGIHLATNALGDIFPAGTEREAFYATQVGDLDHWFDEVLSHWLWHLAWLGFLGLLLWIGTREPAAEAGSTGPAVVISAAAGLIHGFTWFVVTDEGGTWPLAIPATAVLVVLAWLLRGRDPDRVITMFLVVGSLTTLVLYAIWIAWQGWPPASICEAIHC